MEYRNELKFLVKESDFKVLESRIKSIMSIDKAADENGLYNIRSIYFDDCYNSFFKQNENGLDDRYKFRIRIYHKRMKQIKLEIKYKVNGYTKKDSCSLDKELYDYIVGGNILTLKQCTNKVLKKLYIEQHLYDLKPKIIVEYDRKAYTYNTGNVRVTFDKNIRASMKIDRFLEKSTYPIPILDDNYHILEIKYDELLPDYLAQLLEINKLSRVSFSKYYSSRLRFKEEISYDI